MQAKGKQVDPSSLKDLHKKTGEVLASLEPANATSALEKHAAVWKAAGFDEKGLPEFLQKLQSSVIERYGVVASSLATRLKKQIADATSQLGALPAEIESDEVRYRGTMSKQGKHMAANASAIASTVASLREVPEDILAHKRTAGDLLKQAEKVCPLLEWHVCVYSAIVIYRNPSMAMPETKEKKKMFEYLRTTLEKAFTIEFPEDDGRPRSSDKLLDDMCRVAQGLVSAIDSGSQGWLVFRCAVGPGDERVADCSGGQQPLAMAPFGD